MRTARNGPEQRTSGSCCLAVVPRLVLVAVCLPLSNGLVPSTSPATGRPPQRSSAAALREKSGSGGFLEGLFGSTAPAKSPPRVRTPEGFVTPEPKPLQISESADPARFARNTLAFVIRLGVGAFVLGWKIDTVFYKQPEDDGNDNDKDNGEPSGDGRKTRYSLDLGPFSIRDSSSVVLPKPEQPLVLYEYEASPFCKRVRETINLLDLTVEYRPCPGARQGKFSDELFEMTGRRTVPYLYDPNTGEGLFESSDQIEYLLANYGPADASTYDRKALWPVTLEPFSVATSTLCAILLGMPGKARRPDARPDNEEMLPLELWGNEASPFVRNVRETLGGLCLPHAMVSCPRGSSNRDRMVERTGRFQVPYLVDPNTGIEMFESEEIVKYLEEVYTVS